MAISTNELVILLAIEIEAWSTTLGIVCANELEGADANARNATIERLFAIFDTGTYLI